MTVWEFRQYLEQHVTLYELGLFPLVIWALIGTVLKLLNRKPKILTSTMALGAEEGDRIVFAGKSYVVTKVISKTTITIRRPFWEWVRSIFRRK
jgi:hypothetical protein